MRTDKQPLEVPEDTEKEKQTISSEKLTALGNLYSLKLLKSVIFFVTYKENDLLYKHQWNTRWAFARKHDIFTCENEMLPSHMKRPPLLWLLNKSRLSQQKIIKVKRFGISLMFI